jgi:hypothetical protein
LELPDLRKDLDEALLQHILCILTVFRVTIAYRKHGGAEAPVELLLANGIFAHTSLYHCFFRHEMPLISPNL